MSKAASITTSITWEGRTIRLSYLPNKYSAIDHLEIRVDDLRPIPITETGYKSHYFGPCDPALKIDEIIDLVRNWIECEAKSEKWRTAEATRRQGALF